MQVTDMQQLVPCTKKCAVRVLVCIPCMIASQRGVQHTCGNKSSAMQLPRCLAQPVPCIFPRTDLSLRARAISLAEILKCYVVSRRKNKLEKLSIAFFHVHSPRFTIRVFHFDTKNKRATDRHFVAPKKVGSLDEKTKGKSSFSYG